MKWRVQIGIFLVLLLYIFKSRCSNVRAGGKWPQGIQKAQAANYKVITSPKSLFAKKPKKKPPIISQLPVSYQLFNKLSNNRL